jgi:hypothetical protein
MTDGFRTDNELLARRAGAFDGLAERAGRIDSDLRAEVEAHGPCWGDDEVGRAFAEGHVGSAQAAFAGIGALPGELTELGARLSATAATYEESERTSLTAISGAGRLPG